MHKENDGKFILSGIVLIRITNPVELSHKWELINFEYQETESYARLFDESEEGSFEVSPGCTKLVKLKKTLPGATKLIFNIITRVGMCYVYCILCFSLLVKNLQQIS